MPLPRTLKFEAVHTLSPGQGEIEKIRTPGTEVGFNSGPKGLRSGPGMALQRRLLEF